MVMQINSENKGSICGDGVDYRLALNLGRSRMNVIGCDLIWLFFGMTSILSSIYM